MQTLTQDHQSMTARRNAFVVSMPQDLLLTPSIRTAAIHATFRASLTPRETGILELLGRGLSMKGAARELGISAGTVKWHMRNTYEKLGASSREDALSKARQLQLIL